MKFWRNLLSFWRSWKTQFFWVGHFEFFFSKKKYFFCFIPMKTCQSLLVSKDFSKFWWLPWFPATNNTYLKICNTVHIYIYKYNWLFLNYFFDFISDSFDFIRFFQHFSRHFSIFFTIFLTFLNFWISFFYYLYLFNLFLLLFLRKHRTYI